MGAARADVKSIFGKAMAMSSTGERAAYLQQACEGDTELRAEIESLLEAHGEAGSFLVERGPRASATVDDPIRERPGTVIGPYKLMEQIGEGGMGLVFVAEQQQPVRRRVALKVIKPGMDTREVIARFEAERQALALMDHPHIAKVLDAGATDSGRPFFVMELVKGDPITQFCDHNRLAPRARLELFVSVCQAVQHAHQKGIIHRDVKPSNVLVASHDGKPVVKVIDFGVAKAVGQQLTEKTVYTGFSQMVGTPLYMSPEQAGQSGLDIDTRTDIYALGVLLYELLTGTTPFDKERFKKAAYDEIRRIIREEEPPKPSTRLSESKDTLPSISAQRHTEPAKLTRLVRGELDWIVMKCLEKDRNRRYETASAFAADVQRYLNDEPVLACPPSAWYRLRKFARRNKVVLATASALTAAVLLAVGSLAGAVRVLANTNTQITEEQKQTKEALDRETRAKEDLELALYFQRIASAERELASNTPSRAEELLDDCPFLLRGWEWHYLKRLRYQPPLVFRGHANWVMAVAFSPDGKRIASTSPALRGGIGEIKIWERATGRVIHTLLGHIGPSLGVAFSPDGRRLATAGWDRKVKVWDVGKGNLLQTLSGHSEFVVCVAFSPDGGLLASGSADRTIKLWETDGFREVRTLAGHRNAITGLAFSPDGRRLASVSPDRSLRLWETASGKELHVIPTGGTNVAFSPDGRLLATGHGDGSVKLWDAPSGRHVRTLRGHMILTTSVAFSADGRRLATGSWDKTVKVWDLASGQEALTLRGHDDMVTGVAFSPDGLQLVSAGLDKTVRVWDAAPQGAHEGPGSLVLRGHLGAVTDLAYRPDGKILASASLDETVKLWDLATGEDVRTLRGHSGHVASVMFSRDGRRMATADIHGDIKVWDAPSGRELRTFHGYAVHVALSPDGKRLATTREGSMVYVWDTETGAEVLPPFRAQQGNLYCVCFSPDGKRLATAGWDTTAQVWDAVTGRQVSIMRGHAHVIFGLAFSPDGRRLATASWDNTARVWDTTTGEELATLRGHKDRVLNVAFSPDGRLLATASLDNTAKVWDTATGKEIATLSGHSGTVGSVAFSPDGKRLAVGTGYHGKGEITIWDATRWGRKPPGG